MKIVRLKKNNKLGILMIPSKKYKNIIQEFWSLNNVLLEDGTTVMVGDDDIEVINDDRTAEFNKEIEQLYNQ